MNKITTKINKLYRAYKPEFYAFLVPFIIESIVVLLSYAICHFGISSCDCFAQYMPFFTEFYDKLTSGESLFFSWSGAMGYDFWSVFAYYLASPLNWIIFLFGRKGIAFSVNLLILLKTSLCGATFAHFVRKKYGSSGIKLPVLFGTMFALSGYTFGYCFNVMWFDSIVIFPLVLLALERMLYEKKPARYCILLACSLIFNYFIGFMTCIFIFLYFFTCDFTGIKDFFAKLCRIAFTSLIGVGAAAVILLPSFMVLQSTTISSETVPTFELIGKWSDTLYNILFGTNPIAISWTSNKANMFMSGLGVLTAFIFIVSGAFSFGDKLSNIFLVGTLYLSYNCDILNYIWHGFHKQNGIPNRFAFMTIFLLLVMGYRAVQKRSSIKSYEIIIAAVLHTAFLGLIYYLKHSYLEECLITFAIMVIYLAIVLYYRSSRKIARHAIFPVLAELTAMLVITIINVTGMSLDGYFYYVDDMLEAGEMTENVSDGFYREKIDPSNNLTEYIVNDDYDYIKFADLTPSLLLEMIDNNRNIGHHSVLNEESLYSINAGSLFNTFTNSNVSTFVKRTGGLGSSNTILYRGENAFMDMILGFKYYYTRYHTARSGAYEYLDSVGEVDIYENQYALSVGYSVPQEFAELSNYYKSNPFNTMNVMSNAICGENIFKNYKMEYIGCSGAKAEDINSTYAKFTKVGYKAEATWSFTADKAQNFQLYLVCGDMYLIEVRINGELVVNDRMNRQVIDLGELEQNDTVELKVIMKKKSELTMNVYAAAIEKDVLDECYEILSAEQLDVSYCDDNTIEGSVTIAEDDTEFLITAPYSTGWTVTVDGEKVEPDIFSETFILLTLNKGNHEIRLNYVTPGFFYGLMLSIGCFAVIGIMWLITKRRTIYVNDAPQYITDRQYDDAISSDTVFTDNDDANISLSEALPIDDDQLDSALFLDELISSESIDIDSILSDFRADDDSSKNN